MSKHSIYLIIYGEDGTAAPDPSAAARDAADVGGELLALGPLAHVGETDARSAPPWMAIAGFDTDSNAAAWYETAGPLLPGAALLVPAHTEPVWWPDELSGQRPPWTLQPGALPFEPRLFVAVWSNVHDADLFLLDYAVHFKWTVERNGGGWIASGLPTPLRGTLVPTATALMAWPSNEVRKAWYDGADYLPYKKQRMASSDSTVVGIAALRLRPGA